MELDSKIFVAGHRGLVGSAIFRRLQAEGHSNLITRTHSEVDLERQAEVDSFFSKEQPEYVFLAAAKVGGIWANNKYPAEFIYSNLTIQGNVIHAAWKTGVKRLLFMGSSCIYPRECPQPIKEEYLLTAPLEATNEPYAVAKIAGVKMCQSYNRQYGTQYLAVMPTNLYGPKDNFNLETSHVLPALIRKFQLAKLAHEGDWGGIQKDEARFGPIPRAILADLLAITRSSGNPVPASIEDNASGRVGSAGVSLWGTGRPRREFLHVDDLADACLFLMELSGEQYARFFATGLSAPLINIGYGRDITINELAAIIKEIVGFKGDLVFDPAKPDGTPQKLLDVSRLKGLGWAPKISLRAGIENTYDWYLRESAS